MIYIFTLTKFKKNLEILLKFQLSSMSYWKELPTKYFNFRILTDLQEKVDL